MTRDLATNCARANKQQNHTLPVQILKILPVKPYLWPVQKTKKVGVQKKSDRENGQKSGKKRACKMILPEQKTKKTGKYGLYANFCVARQKKNTASNQSVF